MNDDKHSASRRRVMLGLAAGALSLPVVFRAQAADLPKLTLDDPAAQALKYVEDASTLAAGARGGDDRNCASCNFYTAPDQPEWGPCTLFPGKAVSASGWCSGWVKRPA